LAQNGYLIARIYTSKGEIPVIGAIVTVSKNVGGRENIIAKRITDRNGQTAPVTISAPDKALSESPTDQMVFSVVDVRVDHPLYYTVYIKNVQIFAGETTIVDTELVPLIENEEHSNRADEFVETPQNL
jgi:hypothetical protein